jgi:hypothetical protein
MRGQCLPVFAACAMLVGGGPAPGAAEELGTVEGTVTYEGVLMTEGTITFHLKDDQFVGAKLKEGKYRVDRVPAGKVKITFVAKKNRLPEKYTYEETTPLSAEIKAGKNTVNLALTN